MDVYYYYKLHKKHKVNLIVGFNWMKKKCLQNHNFTHFLKIKVKRSIDDCREMEGWANQCQVC